MPKTKKIKLKMYESCAHFTYRGDIKINPDLFPQLKGKNEQEIANWVTEYADELYVNNKDEIVPNSSKSEFTLWNYFHESVPVNTKERNHRSYFSDK